MRDGKHGGYESASSKKAAKPDAVVVPTFDRLPALAEYQNDRLEEFVEHLAGVLREHKAKTASFVFEMEEQDPLMVGHMVLDRALFVIAARWRLPLQSLGLYWNLSLRQDVEMSGTDATVFVNVDLLNEKDEARIEEEKKRSRSKDRDRSRRKRSRRHERSSRERTHDTADEGTRRISSHGSTQTQKTLTAVDVSATIPWQVDEQNVPVRCEVPGQGCTPSPPTSKSASIAVLSPDDAWSQNMEPENGFEMDGLEPPKSLSSTLPWVPEDEGAAAKHDRSPEDVLRDITPDVRAVLRSLLDTEHGLYGSSGGMLKAYPFIVQTQGFEDQPQTQYMVHPGSQDFCHRCYQVVPAGPCPTTCPKCGSLFKRVLLPESTTAGYVQPEIDVIMKYVPCPQKIFSCSGRFTIEGIVGRVFCAHLHVIFVDGFSGHDGNGECLLLWDDSFFPPEGTGFALFNALVVGDCLGKPIFGFPFPGGRAAFVRRPQPSDEVRVLDLFAGLGGWEHAVDLLAPILGRRSVPLHEFVSVEIDPLCAEVLAINSNRIVVHDPERLEEIDDEGVVVCADVTDSSWFRVSICRPFTDVLWSAPCQPWSLAGNTSGFSSHLGLLVAHSIGIILLFRPLRSIGENVAGLQQHPHWDSVRRLLGFLPHHLKVQVTDLRFLSPMCRQRLFLILQLFNKPRAAPHLDLKPRHWLDTGCGFLPPQFWDAVRLSPDQVSKLSKVGYLPRAERTRAYVEDITDGPDVLRRRIAGPVLPTLVACYRNQCSLPVSNLIDKGLLTWLVTEDRNLYEPRFLDCAEAQRLLGFPFSLVVPRDADATMHLFGNSVSPVQGAIVLARAFGCDDLEAVRREILHRLYRQPPLRTLTRQGLPNELSRLTIELWTPRALEAKVENWYVCCDTKLFPGANCEPFEIANIVGLLPFGRRVQIACAEVFLTDQLLMVNLRLEKICVVILSDVELRLHLSPFCTLQQLGLNLLGAVPDLPGSLNVPLWFFGAPIVQLVADVPLRLDAEVRFIFGHDVRVWRIQEGVDIAGAIDCVFPYGLSHLANVELRGGVVSSTEMPRSGETYVVYFAPFRVEVEPFGVFWVDPLTPLGDVANLLSWKQFQGKATVKIVANGTTVDPTQTICFANQLGVLRAKVYALPGGAKWTLSSMLVELQTLLVSHGLSKDAAEIKAHDVYDNIGHAKTKNILENKNPWPALKTECTKAKIVLIPLEERANPKREKDTIFENDPWANWKEPEKNVRSRRPAKSFGAAVAKVDFSFFHSNQSAVTPLALNQLLQGVPGLFVTTVDEMRPHLATVTKNKLSVGAAGVLFLGAQLADLNLGSSTNVESCIVPGWIGPHPSAIQAVLLNCGDEPIVMKKSVSLSIPSNPSEHQVVQYHVYKDTCSKWDLLVQQGFEFFVKAIGFAQVMSISQSWSQGFFKQGKKVSPDVAVYCHGYCKIESKCVATFLRLGGFEGFFPCPRSQGKTSDPTYRVLQLRGFSLVDSRAVLPQDAFGLTRSKCGYGIRVATEKYDATKKSLFPDAAQSSESDNGGASRFHLLGVPSTVDRSALKVALRALKWQVRVSRSSGFKSWVVFSDMVPPTRSFPLAGDTVVVIESSGNGSGPVVASSGKKNQGLALKVSPVSPVAPTDVSAEVSSKFDQLAKQADQKVIDLEAKVQSLSTKIDDQQEKNDTRFSDIESQVKSVGDQMKQQSTDLDAKLEGMFGKLLANQQSCFEKMEKNSELAITALRTEYQTGYTELKEILSQSPTAKARKVAGP